MRRIDFADALVVLVGLLKVLELLKIQPANLQHRRQLALGPLPDFQRLLIQR